MKPSSKRQLTFEWMKSTSGCEPWSTTGRRCAITRLSFHLFPPYGGRAPGQGNLVSGIAWVSCGRIPQWADPSRSTARSHACAELGQNSLSSAAEQWYPASVPPTRSAQTLKRSKSVYAATTHRTSHAWRCQRQHDGARLKCSHCRSGRLPMGLRSGYRMSWQRPARNAWGSYPRQDG